MVDLAARLREYRAYADDAAGAGAGVELPGRELKELLDAVVLLCPACSGSGEHHPKGDDPQEPMCPACEGGGIDLDSVAGG